MNMQVPITDSELYQMSNTTSGFVWYKHTDTLLVKSLGSGHQPPFLRTRFSSIAATKLDNAGKIQSGIVFPEGSLIVKELRNDPITLVRYAVMYKKTGDPNADTNGWLWTYINPDGSSAIPISDKGNQCISCHSQSGNINGVLMNKYQP